MKFPNAVDLFISGRFLKNISEERARELYAELKKLGLEAFIVDSDAGDDFGVLVMQCLYMMKVMVVIGCGEYGALTDNSYCTYWELKDANHRNIHMIVIQMCEEWPPKPSMDKDNRGAQQNSFILGRDGLHRLDWSTKEWNAAECAKQVADAFRALQSTSIRPPAKGIEVKLGQPTSLERVHKTKRALDKVDGKQIDVCIISLHSPSMLHRFSHASTVIYDIEQRLEPLSIENDVSILLVDGSDSDNLDCLLDKDLQDIQSFVLIGEGLEDNSWMAKSDKQSCTSDLLKHIKEGSNSCLPQVSIALRYGATSIKADLEREGFQNVEVWDLTDEKEIVDVWKDVNLFGNQGMLKRHLSSLKKDKKGYPAGVEVLAWSPPTLSWRKELHGNLSLKVGDAEEIDKMKTVLTEAVKSGRTKYFEIQARSSHATNDDQYHRARSITYFTCQESSRVMKDFYSSVSWYYVSKEHHLSNLVKEMRHKQAGSCVVIWIDCIDCSSLNLKEKLEGNMSGALNVIYIVTTTSIRDSMDAVTSKSNVLRKSIRELHCLSDSNNDFKTIVIDPQKTDIDLSQRETSIDVTLKGVSENHSSEELQRVMLKEFFDTGIGGKSVDTTLSLIGKNEASSYKGDGESIHFHVGVRNIKQLKQMFSLIFFPDSRERLENQLKYIYSDIKLQFKMFNSLKVFQQCVLEIESLTKDQKRALKDVRKLRRVLIYGPAGSGKTYVALHCILELLTCNHEEPVVGGEGGLILLCLDAEPLGNHVVKWLCTRLGGNNSGRNEKLKRIHFLYRSGGSSILHRVQIVESDDGEPELCHDLIDDNGTKYEYDLIIVDEGHHVFRKDGGKQQRSYFIPHVSRKSDGDKCRKKIKSLLKKNRKAIAMILCDSSQAPSTISGFPKEFQKEEHKIILEEVVRSMPILTEATKVFQRYNQDRTTNHHDSGTGHQGLRPSASLFKSKSDKDNFETCKRVTVAELKKLRTLFPDENFHNTAAVIVPNDDSRARLLDAGLGDELDEMGFRAVTAMEASVRLSNDPPSDGKGYIIVDTISKMNGMERLFVIVVDMDKPLVEWRNEEANQKNLSEIYCACTRGMLYVSFVNKYIENGWMSFFNFTESGDATPPSDPLPMNKIGNHQEQRTSNDDSRSSSHAPLVTNEIGGNQDDLHFPEKHVSDFAPFNVLSTNESSRGLNQDVSSSASAKRETQEVETDDHIPVGVANDVCRHGKSDAISSYYDSDGDDIKYDVKVMARTKIFDISKSNLDATEDVPTFYPLKPTIGMSKDDPYIYEGGRAPKVPFIIISPDVREIQDNAFNRNDVIELLVIPNTVTHMGKNALERCSKLKYLIFEEGSSLRHIGEDAFYNCRIIEEMNLPSSLETLGEAAFGECKRLKKVTLSPKMKAIEDSTFWDCSSLTAAEGVDDIQSIGQWAFRDCSSLETIDVNQSADIHGAAFIGCNARINRI